MFKNMGGNIPGGNFLGGWLAIKDHKLQDIKTNTVHSEKRNNLISCDNKTTKFFKTTS